MTILVDMNSSPRWQDYLSARGFESIHRSKIGKGNDPDDSIMACAIANEMAILTADLDFGIRLATQGESRPSVVQIRGGDVELEAYGEAVLLALH